MKRERKGEKGREGEKMRNPRFTAPPPSRCEILDPPLNTVDLSYM